MSSEAVQVALLVIDALEDLGIPYQVGGSFASSLHGIPRQTRDLDLVVEMTFARVPLLVARLQNDFYLDADNMRRAIQRHSHFNLIHLKSSFKIDLFCRGLEPFDRSEFNRGKLERLVDEPPRDVIVKSPEDTLLRKLQWYRLGSESSDRQWNDILGILQTQGERLDRDYLRYWAGELAVTDLLDRAIEGS
jgi:hypothetical protein